MASQHEKTQEEKQRRAALLAGLLERSERRLMRQALSHARRRADAEDALGDACVQFLRFYDGPAGEPALYWMLLVVKRCAWALARRRACEPVEDFALPDERPGPAEAVERAEESRQLIGAVAQLKPDQRVALVLLGLGYSYAEISELCGWSMRKVRRCLDEGRARVRRSHERGGR